MRLPPLWTTIGSIRGPIKSRFLSLLALTLLIFSLGCKPAAESTLPAGFTPNAEATQPANFTPPPGVTIVSTRQYAVHQEIKLANEGPGEPEKQNIWVALIHDLPPYQTVQSMTVAPDEYALVLDEYGNQYAEFDFSKHPAGTTQVVKIDYQLSVNEWTYDLADCQGELLEAFLQPELHIEADNPQIEALAGRLSKGQGTACDKVRAFYDYVGNELTYTYNGENWGAQAALGPMGADCTEYTALLVALSRAQGIPARYYEGLLYLDKGTSDIAKILHAWPDVYLPGVGWTALDPTLGRAPVNRETYFAHYTPDHIIVTTGASPSVLRGSSYWTHLYWPGDSTRITVSGEWKIELVSR